MLYKGQTMPKNHFEEFDVPYFFRSLVQKSVFGKIYVQKALPRFSKDMSYCAKVQAMLKHFLLEYVFLCSLPKKSVIEKKNLCQGKDCFVKFC
jgi:hypothetical protein